MFRSLVAVLVVPVILASCSTSTDGAASEAPTSVSAPSQTWLAVLDSATDPNDLDRARADVVAELGEADAAHIVESPGACFTGLPLRYGARYVLAIVDPTDDAVRRRLDRLGGRPEWIGTVTSTCVD